MNYAKMIYSKLLVEKRVRQFPFSNYNRKHKCIFIHIPKVAGTSIVSSLGGKRARRNHLPWYVYYTATPSFYNNAYKFSFVRNPWDRALSAYRYLSEGGNQAGDLKVSTMISKYNGFSDFVVNALGEGLFRNHLLFLPQSDFLINGNQELAVNFVGRYERLDQDFDTVLKQLGVSAPLADKNRSGSDGHYRDYYKDDEAVRVIEEIYKQDILNFNYRF